MRTSVGGDFTSSQRDTDSPPTQMRPACSRLKQRWMSCSITSPREHTPGGLSTLDISLKFCSFAIVVERLSHPSHLKDCSGRLRQWCSRLLLGEHICLARIGAQRPMKALT